MAGSITGTNGDKINYSKLLSSLFCSSSIVVLSFLCLLNNLSLDIYSTCMLLKIVIPASFCFWFIGNVMGKILDKNANNPIQKSFKLSDDEEAYTMPSMFASDSADSINDEDGIL